MSTLREVRHRPAAKPAAAQPPSQPPPPALPPAAEADWAGTLEFFNGILLRLGDVIGAGAVHSLVRYGALSEGSKWAARLQGMDAVEALAVAGRLLHLEVHARRTRASTYEVRVRAPAYVQLRRGGPIGLVVGLIEGVLSSVLRAKFELVGEPVIESERDLLLTFKE